MVSDSCGFQAAIGKVVMFHKLHSAAIQQGRLLQQLYNANGWVYPIELNIATWRKMVNVHKLKQLASKFFIFNFINTVCIYICYHYKVCKSVIKRYCNELLI